MACVCVCVCVCVLILTNLLVREHGMSLEDVPPNFARNSLSEKQVHYVSSTRSLTWLYASILIAPLNSANLDAWIEPAS
jgi:hypothetical protein